MYHYNNNNLLLSYGIGTFITAIGVCLGLYAFHMNGMSHSTSFSAAIVSTRNPDLDIISDYMSKEVLKLKLRFGSLATVSGGGAQTLSRKIRGTRRQVFGVDDGLEYLR
jgi:hypothetical protein